MSGRVAPSNVVIHNDDDADIRCVPGTYCTWVTVGAELCCVAVHDHGGLFTGSQTMQYSAVVHRTPQGRTPDDSLSLREESHWRYSAVLAW